MATRRFAGTPLSSAACIFRAGFVAAQSWDAPLTGATSRLTETVQSTTNPRPSMLSLRVEQKPSEQDALRHYVWLRGESTAPSTQAAENLKIVRWLSKTVWVKPVQSGIAEF